MWLGCPGPLALVVLWSISEAVQSLFQSTSIETSSKPQALADQAVPIVRALCLQIGIFSRASFLQTLYESIPNPSCEHSVAHGCDSPSPPSFCEPCTITILSKSMVRALCLQMVGAVPPPPNPPTKLPFRLLCPVLAFTACAASENSHRTCRFLQSLQRLKTQQCCDVPYVYFNYLQPLQSQKCCYLPYLQSLKSQKCCYLLYLQPLKMQKCCYSQYLKPLTMQKCCYLQYLQRLTAQKCGLWKRRNAASCSMCCLWKNATPFKTNRPEPHLKQQNFRRLRTCKI